MTEGGEVDKHPQHASVWHQQGAVTCHHSAGADWLLVDIFQEYSAPLSLITLGGTSADLSSSLGRNKQQMDPKSDL